MHTFFLGLSYAVQPMRPAHTKQNISHKTIDTVICPSLMVGCSLSFLAVNNIAIAKQCGRENG